MRQAMDRTALAFVGHINHQSPAALKREKLRKQWPDAKKKAQQSEYSPYQLLTIDEITKQVIKWLEIAEISYSGWRHRVVSGMSKAEAITKPLNGRKGGWKIK